MFRGRIVTVALETARFPDGRHVPLEIVRHPGGAAVVALRDDGHVCILRQYRHVTGSWLWELPAGKLEAGVSPLHTARNELAEEAGLAAARWESLGAIHSSPGVFSEVVHLYLARDLSPASQSLEAGELLEVHWMALERAVDLAHTGEMSDAKSVIALLRAAARLGAEPGAAG